MEVTYRCTKIEFKKAHLCGHYWMKQFNKRGDLIYANIVTDSMAYDDYNELKSDSFSSNRERDAMLKNVRLCLTRDKEWHK